MNIIGVRHNGQPIFLKIKTFSAPTQSLLQKWLREEHSLHIMISCLLGGGGYMFDVLETMYGDKRTVCVKEFKTYEEALENGLQEALKLI